ncbi:MAG: hypothetical protein A2504_12815 [Bdellovibrionales bacterium RIFOXYD12_FULL_39_22]|nr:MAG: hypothetical protein A2385_03900 [Bdellovibrionales bacterium RIFOXYB1_FULL_39_21]OFZ40496.1 MAG: hypothetical protein A2485_02765 [Bdellovibrionales bacterium RIFOXYC12_FULL_39_17]OFZ49979.1 MAG: hypothetical protein A2404_02100 [Bdellovibrionales bacterium RIFOXYC1_FULL_39_130]OFZ77621.1 MAG: hypothetical protein A2560_04660 [Bdellovibrionales bacterium RIFOXYD1_FULL_39_84]OFZ96075.1 MAG: hypothetical protein A2504_12815 [Bdellovibrionales bacterium RIFOXYD12_FULL_39_22]HLE10636.1 io
MRVTKFSLKYIVWQILVGISIAISLIDAPLAFVLDFPLKQSTLLLDGIMTSIFIIDFFINHFFGPEGKNKKNRLRSSAFWIDLLASIPFDLIAYWFNLPHWLRILRLIRVLRMLKFVQMFVTIGNLAIIPSAVKAAFVISGTLITINAIGCGWLWIYPPGEVDQVTAYIKAIYWTITTVATIGYGDITPSDNLGRIFTMFVMVGGVVMYGIVIGSISKMIEASSRHKEQSKTKLNDLRLFVEHYALPEGLSNEIFSFYGHILTKRLSENDEQIIAELPIALQRDIKTYMNMKLISNVPAFKLCSIECLKDIAKSLQQMAYSPGEKIITTGDIGSEMFIIGHGSVEVFVGSNSVANLKSGQFFGEIALLEEVKRTADVVSQTYCDLYKLSKDNFLNLIKKYPELLKNMEKFMAKKLSALKE